MAFRGTPRVHVYASDCPSTAPGGFPFVHPQSGSADSPRMLLRLVLGRMPPEVPLGCATVSRMPNSALEAETSGTE